MGERRTAGREEGGGEREESIILAIRKYHKETRGKEVMFRYDTSSDYSMDTYSCSYCLDFTSDSYMDLLLHTDTAHGGKVLTCIICQNLLLNDGPVIAHACSSGSVAAVVAAPAKDWCDAFYTAMQPIHYTALFTPPLILSRPLHA